MKRAFQGLKHFGKVTRQMHNIKAVIVGGVLRQYLAELEKEPDDLIGQDKGDESNLDEGHFTLLGSVPKKCIGLTPSDDLL